MNRQFSCRMILLTLLFAASGSIYASSVVGIAGESVLVKGSTEAATAILDKAGIEATTEAVAKLATSISQGAREALAVGETDAETKLAAVAKEMGTTFEDSVNGLKNLKVTTENIAKLDPAQLVTQDISKLTGTNLTKALTDAGMGQGEAKAITQMQEESAATTASRQETIFKKGVVQGPLMKTTLLENLTGKGLTTAEADEADAAEKLANDLTQPAAVRAENAAKAANLRWKEATPAGKLVRLMQSTPHGIFELAKYGGGTMAAAVLFMIPSIFQSSFLAQEAQNALLQTYIPPTQFGNIVMQLPDSVINMANPAASQFIYYGIPVSSPGAKLSAAAAAQYPGVSGPDKNNKISANVSNSYAKAFSLGAAKSLSLPRYNLNAQALGELPIFVSYSSQSWSSWAANGIPDAAFPQTMINLNTGYIFYADGTSQGTSAAPLAGVGGTTETVQSFLATKYGQLKSAAGQTTYTQYVNAYSGSKGTSVASPLASQFDCSCLEANKGVLSAATVGTCSAKGTSSCLLTSALNQLAAGLAINSSGTVLKPTENLAAEVAKGALGQVIPIQGLGANFNSILQQFPGAQQKALANSGALTVKLGTNLSSASSVKVQGAEPDNYSAKGIYIYQCQNTPLAKILRSQAGGSATTGYASQITDYIVFLDENLNQVPMMTPVQDPTNYNFIKFGLNPAIQYVSTIIGSVDSSGNFSFLPQLNIQSPAALVAKGLPATFAPLYGLTAANGSLSVNYNQNLPSVIGAIVQSLSNNPKLGQQFKAMQSAMLGLLGSGPYGKYSFNPVASNMQPVIGGVNLVLYTGYNGYPVPQDVTSSNCSDVLIPLSAQGKTVTLPSNNVAQYYGLVTDITYTVNPDGSLSVGSNGLTNSPLSQTGSGSNISFSINQAQAGQFYWMNKLTAMGQNSNPNFVMPAALTNLVTQARTNWINWIQSSATNSGSNAEFAGITIPGTSTVLTIVGQQALSAGLYLYTCNPNPSNLAQDYFVLTNSSSPSASDSTLGTIDAINATASTNLLSVVSGILYNASGTPVTNSAGVNYSVNATNLLQALSAAHPNGFSTALAQTLNIASGQASSAAQTIQYPIPFGSLQLGIYQADLNTGTYLYLNAAGAGTSANFVPSDYFVTIDSYTNPSTVATQLSSTTQYIVSLVSGNVYNSTGVQAVMPANQLTALIGSLSPSWRSGVASQIATLTANLGSNQQALQQQTTAMNNAPVQNSGVVTWPQASVVQIINNLANQNYLASPYSMMKQDTASGQYVLVAPADATGATFIYTFFNVANNIVSPTGGSTQVAATYDGQGNLLRVIQGVEYASMLQQYGISIDSSGKQYLGANNILPIMQLDPADLNLQPGVSGKSMIYSNDPNFPSHGIVSPISYQNGQFYIYFNTLTLAYYAMFVNGSSISYIDMAGGSVYNQNGSPQVALNPVALNSNGNATDLFLPYLNPDDFVQFVMQNNGNNNVYSDFLNIESNFQANVADPASGTSCGLNTLCSLDATATNVQVAQIPFPNPLTAMPDLTVANQYNVYWNQSTTPVTYNINPAYQWQNLQILPINMQTRAILNPAPAPVYNFARLVLNNNTPYALIFGNKFYSNAQKQGGNSYKMTSGSTSVTVAIAKDIKTNVQYVVITSGNAKYNYQYTFLELTPAQLQNYQSNVWQCQTVADITGKIVLEKILPTDSSGNVQLSPVSMQAVVNPPTSNTAAMSTLTNNLGNILQDTVNGRFLASVSATAYPYFTQGGYVDLETGVLFTSNGAIVGYTLQLSDLTALLQQLLVAVVRNATNTAALMYYGQTSAAAPSQTAQSNVVTSSGMSTATMTAGSVATNVVSSGPAISQAAPVATQTAMPTMQPTVAPVSQVNPQIAALQQQNAQLQANITVEQNTITSMNALAKHQKGNPNLTNQINISQNIIAKDNQQIAANNKQIAALQASAAVAANQSRSTVLGRLSTKAKGKKK
ncbi:MAG: hypothetical protein JO129_00415 [Candidatus Dependentiae bacterium]|nr:hypothetical protein [Candidatus Dependentiae bacterium]